MFFFGQICIFFRAVALNLPTLQIHDHAYLYQQEREIECQVQVKVHDREQTQITEQTPPLHNRLRLLLWGWSSLYLPSFPNPLFLFFPPSHHPCPTLHIIMLPLVSSHISFCLSSTARIPCFPLHPYLHSVAMTILADRLISSYAQLIAIVAGDMLEAVRFLMWCTIN